MGNRAVITTKEHKIGVYLHWNGGLDSVRAFLAYCKIKDYRPPEKDDYGWARLCQVIGNFFGGTCSVGINTVDRLDCHGDNGVYIIEDWKVVGRENYDWPEQLEYDLKECLIDLDKCQPVKEQVGIDKIEEYLKENENV